MSKKPMDKEKRPSRFRLLRRFALLIAIPAMIFFLFAGSQDEAGNAGTTFVVRRGTLPITVVEGGSAKSLNPQEIKCEVSAYSVKILYLVDEGYRITREDIEDRKLLIELDSADFEDRLMEEDMAYQSAKAAYMKAIQDYEIQSKENDSEIKASERDVRFKGMDFQKYLGEAMADELMAELERRIAVTRTGEDAEAARDLVEQATAAATGALAAAEKARADAEAEREKFARRAREAAARGDPPVPSTPKVAPAVRPTAPANATARPAARSSSDMRAMFRDAASGAMNTLRVEMTSSLERASELEEDMTPEQLATEAVVAERFARQTVKNLDRAEKAFLATTTAAGVEPTRYDDGALVYTVEFTDIGFSKLAEDGRLGGEAAQERKRLSTEIMLEEEDLVTAEKDLEGMEKLFEHDFVTEKDLVAARMAVKRKRISLDAKQTNEQLFFKYDFPKKTEEAYSAYEEALLTVDRLVKTTATKLESARVNMEAHAKNFMRREREKIEHEEDLTKFKIYAETEGLVVYGDPGRRHDWDDNDIIREGAEVRRGKTLLTIPDITRMAVTVSIHESTIKKIEKGQEATIRVEAYPDEVLTGIVTKVAVLPSAVSRYFSPDMKVYETTIAVDGVYEWLKPGMTAQVEIAVNELRDVLYVPLQAVASVGKERVCYLESEKRRVVETGEFNDKYIEIKSGLEDGDVILLAPPQDLEELDEDGEMDETPDEPVVAETPTAKQRQG